MGFHTKTSFIEKAMFAPKFPISFTQNSSKMLNTTLKEKKKTNKQTNACPMASLQTIDRLSKNWEEEEEEENEQH